eukprot:10383490-Alexandrium_andersonii.AAC.1
MNWMRSPKGGRRKLCASVAHFAGWLRQSRRRSWKLCASTAGIIGWMRWSMGRCKKLCASAACVVSWMKCVIQDRALEGPRERGPQMRSSRIGCTTIFVSVACVTDPFGAAHIHGLRGRPERQPRGDGAPAVRKPRQVGGSEGSPVSYTHLRAHETSAHL